MLAPERLAGLGAAAAPKLARMRAALGELGSALVAFSGGVDSTFVLQVALDVLGPRAVALTALSASVAPEERREAIRLAQLLGAQHVLVDSAELQNPAYQRNPTDRCYFCKSELYALCERTRVELGLAAVVDGFNADDRFDHRPGHRAAEEARVHSPLAEAGLTKEEIRALSQAAGLPTWDKPAMPCLASRIPYGTPVTEERLAQVGSAESELRALGLRTFRVRYHGEVARLEVAAEELARFADAAFRERVNSALLARGFKFVALDLEPFRSGRLNEAAGIRPGAS
ncbi:MAG: ATP-dependent sacrificial sulfur transferase LarE [Myxococcaceae bacterium]